jgi:hypothetical protein
MRLHRAALAAILLATGSSVGCSDETFEPPTVEVPPEPITTRFELKTGMRKLWTDHVLWTRVFLISALADLPDTEAATARLLRNQDDIGAAIVPIYGKKAGEQLTMLLREHITGAAALVAAAKAGDAVEVERASAAWYENADAIARFLASANPELSHSDLKAMMDMHLDQTLVEATARIEGKFAKDIRTYDQIVHHILGMSDALTDGIARQHPELVAQGTLTDETKELHFVMRRLWSDHVAWTRIFLVDAIAGLPEVGRTTERLLANQAEIGDAIRPFYGDEAADELTRLLEEHIALAAQVVAEAKSASQGNLVAGAKARWYVNADQIAGFLAKANPNWARADLEDMMRAHLDQTLAEAAARLTADWEGDVVAYDAALDHILHMADVLSAGIAEQFPQQLGR